QPDRACPGIPLARSIAIALVLTVRAAFTVSRPADSGHLDIHQPLRGVSDQFPQEIVRCAYAAPLAPRSHLTIALGDYPRKVNHGLGHRALLRCRGSLNNLRLRRSAVAASPAARCATPKGSARGLLHHRPGHYR